MAAYYNEIDPEKAECIRELIRAGIAAPGDVDERSITDVGAEDLKGYVQCHFFAGIAVWSYSLRLAGWPDDRPVWTGSCPCPSFSCAGKGRGFDDPRHLWPDWVRLVRVGRPPVLFGEQSDDAIGYGWLDLVQTDLEAENYAVGKAVLGAASVGAPHIRQRLYFCADAADARCKNQGEYRSGLPLLAARSEQCGGAGDCSDFASVGHERRRSGEAGTDVTATERCVGKRKSERLRDAGDSLHAIGPRLEGQRGDVREWRGPGWLDPLAARSVAKAGATRGFWGDCDWWHGRDGKYRPIGPGLFPLAHGAAARVLRLRNYGDAIVPQVAAAFIESYCEARQS